MTTDDCLRIYKSFENLHSFAINNCAWNSHSNCQTIVWREDYCNCCRCSLYYRLASPTISSNAVKTECRLHFSSQNGGLRNLSSCLSSSNSSWCFSYGSNSVEIAEWIVRSYSYETELAMVLLLLCLLAYHHYYEV